jgi:K+-sensing histidine kinase KdpD
LAHFRRALTALRELALRRTAERVDEQLLTHMQVLYRRPGPRANVAWVCLSATRAAASVATAAG